MWMSLLMVVLAGLLAGVATFFVHRHARPLGLIAAPNHRSSHAQPLPSGGGVGMVVGGVVAGAWVCGFSSLASWPLWAAMGLSLLIAGVGLWDDIHFVSVRIRLMTQLATSAGLVGLFGMPFVLDFPLGITLSGAVVFFLLCLVGVWWINLFNFMDGIDGLAGAQAAFMLAAAAGLAVWGQADVTAQPAWLWMVCLLAATLGFLWLNWPPAKIFMGDVGSTYLACMIFFFALASVQGGWLSYLVWLILGALFASDATVTLLVRLLRGERITQAHCSHSYQRLVRRWGSHRQVTMGGLLVNSLWLAPLAAACLKWPGWAVAWVLLAYIPLITGAFVVGSGRGDELTPVARDALP